MGASDDKVLDAFRQRYAYDRGLGRLKPVEHYQRIFGGFDEAVAREFERLDAEARRRESAERAATDRDPAPPEPPRDAAESSELRVGHYRILRELGRGGQAVVHLAEDARLSRNVALKVFAPGLMPSEQFLARFRREVELASRLDHPGICTVYEAGLDGETPYIAMRYVEGTTLAHCIDTSPARRPDGTTTSRLDLPAAADSSLSGRLPEVLRVAVLVEKTARALHAAHEAGLIHRDVKPGNIMVTKDGEPVLLDFGLARDDEEDHGLTMTGTLLGTPAYMSPEQLLAQRIRLDRRTDVYSLGVTLYECLTLKRPFDAPTREGLYQKILASEADPPRRANPQIPRDLEVVLLTAMEKNRDRRYQTALDFAEDLRRVRDHEPIRARPTPPLVRLGRWMQRHPALATGVVAVFAILAFGLATTAYYVGQLGEEQQRTLDQLRRARTMGLVMASGEARDVDSMRALLLAREAAKSDLAPAVLNRLHEAVFRSCERAVLAGHGDRVVSARFSPAGDRIVTASVDGTGRVWDLAGREIAVLRGHEDLLNSAVSSPSGDRIVTASKDRTARVWDLAGNQLAVLRGHQDFVVSAFFSPSGDRIVTSSFDRTARVWDLAGNQLAVLSGHTDRLQRAVFFPAGDRVLTTSEDRTARIWDLAGNELRVLRGHEDRLWYAELSPRGDRFVTTSFDRTARVWDLEGNLVTVLRGHELEVYRATFSPAGDRIVTASGDRTARIWDAADGKELAVLRGHDGVVLDADFSPTGDRVATASLDGTARVWSREGALRVVLRGHRDQVQSARFSPAGEMVATASSDGTARVWSATAMEAAVLRLDAGNVSNVRIAPSGDRIVTTAKDRTVRLWDLAGKPMGVLQGGHTDRAWFATFAPAGDRVATASADRTARLWDRAGNQLAVMTGHELDVNTVAFSPASDRVVTASDDKTARVWDLGGNQLTVLRGHTDAVTSAEFSAAGDRIVTASKDRTARVWDLAGNQLAVSKGHAGWVWRAQFAPAGDRVVTASRDRTAKVWDISGNELATLRGHEEWVLFAAFSPAGDRIVTTSFDKTARVWGLDGTELAVLRGHGDIVNSATFSAGADRVVTACRDGTIATWLLNPAELLRLADSRVTRDFTEDERRAYGELFGGAK